MSYVDAFLLLSDAQAVTATAVATNVVDTTTLRQLGAGEPLAVEVTVDVAADATTGDETYAFGLETDDNSGMASPVVLQSMAIARAALVAGYRFAMVIPMERVERYLGLRYTTGGTTPTITVTASIKPLSMIESNKLVYPKGYTITG